MDQQQAQQPIIFGDIMQKVSLTLFTDLNKLLIILKPLSPELRSIRLNAYVTDSKRKLTQLLLIRRWLSLSNTIPYFNSITTVANNLNSLDNINNEIQDGLYFTHRDLFSMRVRSININLAYNIINTKTYPYLPQSIFTHGHMPTPTTELPPLVDYSDIDDKKIKQKQQQDLLNDLTLYIKAKVYLYDHIPAIFTTYNNNTHNNNIHTHNNTHTHTHTTNSIHISSGIIRLTRPNLYLIELSLQYLHESSPWKVIRYQCLVQSTDTNNSSTYNSSSDANDTHTSSSSQFIKQYESSVVRILTLLSQEERAWQEMMSEDNRLIKPNTTTTSYTTSSSTNQRPLTSSTTVPPNASSSTTTNQDGDTSTPMFIDDTAALATTTHITTASTTPTVTTPTLDLSRINYICTHTSEAIIIRYLYQQLLILKNEIADVLGQVAEVDFQDISGLSYLIVRFHPAPLTGYVYSVVCVYMCVYDDKYIR